MRLRRPLDRDLVRIYAAALTRSLAAGFAGVYLGLEFARRGFDPVLAGAVVTAGLAGHSLATLAVTIGGDRFGRRRALALLASVAALGGIAAARVPEPRLLVLVAFAGLLNGFGRDRGAALALEQAAMPNLAPDERRTWTIAVHSLLQDLGHAGGSLLVVAVPVAATAGAARSPGLSLYAFLLALGVPLAATLSARVEPPAGGPRRRSRLSPASRARLVRLCALFGVDSFAGGFLSSALLSWFFFERFGAGVVEVGALFAAARLANALSHLGAAWLAGRIGLVNTMVFTHLPSSLLLATVPFAPSFPVAALLFLLREGLVEMDVPTRQSYVMGILRPEERTFAAGATLLVRTAGWSAGPVVAGWATARWGLAAPLVVAAALKIGYDIALWLSFRALPPPEERAADRA